MRHPTLAALAALAFLGSAAAASAEVFDYRPDILPDPFEPYEMSYGALDAPEPWQVVSLDQIRVIGIISQTRDARARMIIGGEYFNVRVGMLLGTERARVVRIADSEVILQLASIVDGKVVLQERKLKL